MRKKALKWIRRGVFLFLFLALLHPPVNRTRRLSILCLGDSLTASLYGNYPAYLKKWLRSDRRIRISEAARPGNTSGEYLIFLKSSGILEKTDPDIVLLMLGTNDTRIDGDHTSVRQFQRNMESILGLIKAPATTGKKNRAIFIATIPPIFKSDLAVFDETSSLRISSEINPVIRNLAEKNGLALVEIERVFLRNPELLPGVHPNREGYRAIARTFCSALLTSLH